MEIKSYVTMEGYEFEKLVEKHLGFEYSMVASNECSNYACYKSDKVTKTDMDSPFNQDYWLPEIESCIEVSREVTQLSYHQILAYMVWKGILPEGNYLIDPSW